MAAQAGVRRGGTLRALATFGRRGELARRDHAEHLRRTLIAHGGRGAGERASPLATTALLFAVRGSPTFRPPIPPPDLAKVFQASLFGASTPAVHLATVAGSADGEASPATRTEWEADSGKGTRGERHRAPLGNFPRTPCSRSRPSEHQERPGRVERKRGDLGTSRPGPSVPNLPDAVPCSFAGMAVTEVGYERGSGRVCATTSLSWWTSPVRGPRFRPDRLKA